MRGRRHQPEKSMRGVLTVALAVMGGVGEVGVVGLRWRWLCGGAALRATTHKVARARRESTQD